MRPHDVKEILINTNKIVQRVDELVDTLAAEMNAPLLIIGILKGSFVFLADLVRSLYRHDIHPYIDFLTLSSYGSKTVSSGTVQIVDDLHGSIVGMNILLVDDILDSGRTLAFTRQLLINRGARSVRTCVLLDKQVQRADTFEADLVGFPISNDFVVGYGLDYNGLYRELPHIAKVSFYD